MLVSSQPPFAASLSPPLSGIILLIWLSEKVGFFATTFSRHGRLDASIILLIWLSEKVLAMRKNVRDIGR